MVNGKHLPLKSTSRVNNAFVNRGDFFFNYYFVSSEFFKKNIIKNTTLNQRFFTCKTPLVLFFDEYLEWLTGSNLEFAHFKFKNCNFWEVWNLFKASFCSFRCTNLIKTQDFFFRVEESFIFVKKCKNVRFIKTLQIFIFCFILIHDVLTGCRTVCNYRDWATTCHPLCEVYGLAFLCGKLVSNLSIFCKNLYICLRHLTFFA